jgi:hypothetical protein
MSGPSVESGSLPPCPAWCSPGSHVPAFPGHMAELGAVALSTTQGLEVALYQYLSRPVELWLSLVNENGDHDTISLDLTQAHGLYDLVGDALTRLGVEL